MPSNNWLNYYFENNKIMIFHKMYILINGNLRLLLKFAFNFLQRENAKVTININNNFINNLIVGD